MKGIYLFCICNWYLLFPTSVPLRIHIIFIHSSGPSVISEIFHSMSISWVVSCNKIWGSRFWIMFFRISSLPSHSRLFLSQILLNIFIHNLKFCEMLELKAIFLLSKPAHLVKLEVWATNSFSVCLNFKAPTLNVYTKHSKLAVKYDSCIVTLNVLVCDTSTSQQIPTFWPSCNSP